jgi:hypothetical protein
MSLFADIWDFIRNIFGKIEAEWHKLSKEIKNGIQYGSGIVSVITKNIEATPQFLLDIIQKEFPNINIEDVKKNILTVAADVQGLGQTATDDIYTTLTNLQAYFKKLGGAKWEQEASIIAQRLAALFVPPTTPFATIVTFIEFVYQTIIKH